MAEQSKMSLPTELFVFSLQLFDFLTDQIAGDDFIS
jgi:hypothetical protein